MVKNKSGAIVWVVALAVLLVVGVVLALLVFRGDDNSGDDNSLSGTVTYDAEIEIPADAKLTIQLYDVAQLDSGDDPIAQVVITDFGPMTDFTLAYDPDDIDQNKTYIIGANISVSPVSSPDNLLGLLLVNSTRQNVITDNNPKMVEINLIPVDQLDTVQTNSRDTYRQADIAALRDLMDKYAIANDNLPEDSSTLEAEINNQANLAFYVNEDGQATVTDQTDTAADNVIVYSDEAPTSGESYPGPNTVHIRRGYTCNSYQLAGGNPENGDSSYAPTDLNSVNRYTLALIYQLEGEELSNCQTHPYWNSDYQPEITP